jgi:hypothetical protein
LLVLHDLESYLFRISGEMPPGKVFFFFRQELEENGLL